jgi:hypothetical protein
LQALDPKDLGPLLSKLNANQLMGITNAQMAGLEGAYLNQLTVLLNFVQEQKSLTLLLMRAQLLKATV